MVPKRIVIVGGGTAGWMCANMFAHHWQNHDTIITLVESDSIATVGVGEGSTPFLRQFFHTLNIKEHHWMEACDATFKCGIAFPNWTQSPANYFHPFYSEVDQSVAEDFFHACQLRRQGYDCATQPDDYFVTAHLAYQHRTPVDPNGFDHGVDYGYHFDAEKLAKFLSLHAQSLGVQRIIDTVTQVHTNHGKITAIETQHQGNIEADLYVDCSGFRGLLIRQALQEPYIDYSDYLLVNRAVALGTPNRDSQNIPSYTTSKALEHGWMWSIPLQSRTGNGYVYSDQYLSPQQAEQKLREELQFEQGDVLHLQWTPGRIEQHWKGNCLAIGLSQGFLEPLEAPMLNMIQHSIECFIEHYDRVDGDDALLATAKLKFNQTINTLIDGTRDYLQAHYVLNSRNDSPFWSACRENPTRSRVLNDIVDGWQSNKPFDPILARHVSSLAYMKTSWYCLLSGMGAYQPATQSSLRLASRKHARAIQKCEFMAAQFPLQGAYFSANSQQKVKYS